MDMRFYSLRDRENQKQFKSHWAKGENNLADYHAKQHQTQNHRNVRKLRLASSLMGN